jgi:hypothetical protein
LNLDALSQGIRGITLGRDRTGHEYLLLGMDYYHIYVRTVGIKDTSEDSWITYTPDQVKDILATLSPKIFNEYQLSWNLRKYFIDVNLQESSPDKNLEHVKDTPYVYFLADTYPFAVSKLTRPEMFDTLNRCKRCQDIWRNDAQAHCTSCHESYDRSISDHTCAVQNYPEVRVLSLWSKIAKASLLDLQLAIPTDAYVVKKALSGDLSVEWRKNVKQATSFPSLVDSLSDLETRIDRGFVAKEYNR